MSLLATLRRLVSVLVVFGMFASAIAYALPGAMGQMVVATGGPEQNIGMPCGTMAGLQGPDAKAKGEMPCNTITADCVKKIACSQTVALPEGRDLSLGSIAFGVVSYSVNVSRHKGLTLKPELFPPLAA